MSTATAHNSNGPHGDDHGDAAHAHSPHLAHHFDTPEQQYASGKLGMWSFLATELLMFGGLFCAYAVYRHLHPEVFLFAHEYLDKIWGGINTGVLILSSFTMAWAVRASQMGNRGLMKVLLALTFMGGVGFLGIKYVEYKSKFQHALAPGTFNAYNPKTGTPEKLKIALDYKETHAAGGAAAHSAAPVAGGAAAVGHSADAAHAAGAGHSAAAEHSAVGAVVAHSEKQSPGYVDPHAGTGDQAKIFASFNEPMGLAPTLLAGHHRVAYTELPALSKTRLNTFFGVYFIMTGLHGVHVVVGMGIIAWLFFTGNRYGPEYYTPVDIGGLYWHLVDLIWIFLFPLLYLIH